MRRTFSVSAASTRRQRAPWLVALLVVLTLLPGTTAAASPGDATPAAAPAAAPAAPIPATTGDAVLATFSGSVRGIILLKELADGDLRVSVTLLGAPSGRMRLVGSTADCATPVSSANRAFSIAYQRIDWVRGTVSGLLEEEGIWYVRTLRLIKPGSPSKQVACRPVRLLLSPTAPTVAYELSNVLITSYVVAGGVRGMIATGPGFADPVPLHAVIQRRAPGQTYRLVGSSAPCGTKHQANETVFDRTFPASGVITRGITALDDWEAGVSFRIFRGSGFSKQAGCFQDGIQEFEEIV